MKIWQIFSDELTTLTGTLTSNHKLLITLSRRNGKTGVVKIERSKIEIRLSCPNNVNVILVFYIAKKNLQKNE